MQLAFVFSGDALILYGEAGHQQWPDLTGDLMFLFAHSEDSLCILFIGICLDVEFGFGTTKIKKVPMTK